MTKDKILFWFDVDLEQFGIAHAIQKKYDADFFAIVDINDQIKNFFNNQNLVQFKKIWFYRDFVKDLSKNQNEKYLESFEKKYGIDLWNLAYTERYFFNYNTYHDFSKAEIMSILENECKLFEKILQEINPDYLVIKVTDYHQNHLLHQMCKSLGIKILMYGRTRIGNRSMISTDFDKIDNSLNHEKPLQNKTFEDLQKFIKSYSTQQTKFRKKFRSSLTNRIISGLHFLTICDNQYRKYYAHFGRTKLRVIWNEILFLINKKKRESFLEKNCIKNIPKDYPFAYFAMHLEPERALSISAPNYTNQLYVIESIAKSLPVDFKLIVKDHPQMGDSGWRDISYYEKILKIPNVELIHHFTSDEELIKNSSLVITIAGTSSMSAAFYGKPSIVFADTIFSPFISSIKKVEQLDDLPKIILSSINTTVDISELNNYVELVKNNSFEFDWNYFRTKLSNDYYYGGYLTDFDISEAMSKILEEFDEEFEKLACEHIKKIEEK